MKIKDYKCKCGHDDFFFVDKGNQKGIYCSYCGKWLKWADKDEKNLLLKQKRVLDKLKAKIKQLKHQNTDVSGYRWWNNAIDNCLHEIDAFKAESEE